MVFPIILYFIILKYCNAPSEACAIPTFVLRMFCVWFIRWTEKVISHSICIFSVSNFAEENEFLEAKSLIQTDNLQFLLSTCFMSTQQNQMQQKKEKKKRNGFSKSFKIQIRSCWQWMINSMTSPQVHTLANGPSDACRSFNRLNILLVGIGRILPCL